MSSNTLSQKDRRMTKNERKNKPSPPARCTEGLCDCLYGI